MLYPEGRESMLLIARQYRHLSINQALRNYSLANCIHVALEHAIIFLANRGHEKLCAHVQGVRLNHTIFPREERPARVRACIAL